MKIVFSSNISWSIYNFRVPLLKSLKEKGYEIYTLAAKDNYSKKLENEGFHFEEINLNNNATNPIEDLLTIYKYYKIYKKIKPDIICHNAIKPNIYGTIAAGFLRIPVINNISGLGTLFIKDNFSTKIAKILYKISQKKATIIFFQNNDDLDLFVNSKLVNKDKCKVIPGSGVNTSKFSPKKNSDINKKPFSFLFVGRLIYDKGIREYINAIEVVRKIYANVEFQILGPIYKDNATAISEEDLKGWINTGTIKYLGETDDVASFMKQSNCLVLPSYREGLSKVLIEASSLSLPIITTNVPGCRDVVIHNETGFLCNVKSSIDLAEKMIMMVKLSKEERISMGKKGRQRAIDVFDEKIIIKHYEDAIFEITNHLFEQP